MNQNSRQPVTAEGAGRHTPGDWEVYRNPGGELEVLANRPGSLCPLICTVNQEQDSEGGRIAVCGGDPVANAHVLAAGPELLAALKFMLGKLEVALAAERRATLAPYPKSGVEYVGVDPADCEEVKQARAAIAKAEGK